MFAVTKLKYRYSVYIIYIYKFHCSIAIDLLMGSVVSIMGSMVDVTVMSVLHVLYLVTKKVLYNCIFLFLLLSITDPVFGQLGDGVLGSPLNIL